MGARAQVLIKETGVYLYTHWGSGSLEDVVNDAVNSRIGRSRRTDTEYLTRIIFCAMIKAGGCDFDGETGFGIGTEEHGDIELLVTVTENEVKAQRC